MRHLFVFAIVAGAMFGMAGSVRSQDRRVPRRMVTVQEDFVVRGRPHTPNAFYVLDRAPLGRRDGELRTSFMRDVRRSVRRDPF